MLKLELRTLGLTAIIVSSLLLQACGQSEQAPEQKVEIKAAPKITMMLRNMPSVLGCLSMK